VNGRDDAADVQLAYSSLFNGRPPRPWGEKPWPKAKPYVNAWCPHPTKRCRIGAVYATRWGYLWLHVSRLAIDRGKLTAGYTLLTFPDGTRRDFLHMSSPGEGCRHAVPHDWKVPFAADELLDLLAAVHAGRTPRPADYVAPWERRAVY
jgi:hypothetical protein